MDDLAATSGGLSPGHDRLIGLLGWAVIIGAALAWEGLGLVHGRERWPSFSDVLRTFTRPVAGRWILFALWLWLGWHLFVRGWQSLLRGAPSTGGPLPPAIAGLGAILRQVVIPLLATYVVLLAMLAYRASRGRRARVPGAAMPLSRLLRYLLATVAGGYLAFLAIVGLYYALVAGESPTFLRQAVEGGALLAFGIALPLFALASAVPAVRAGRRAPGAPA